MHHAHTLYIAGSLFVLIVWLQGASDKVDTACTCTRCVFFIFFLSLSRMCQCIVYWLQWSFKDLKKILWYSVPVYFNSLLYIKKNDYCISIFPSTFHLLPSISHIPGHRADAQLQDAVSLFSPLCYTFWQCLLSQNTYSLACVYTHRHTKMHTLTYHIGEDRWICTQPDRSHSDSFKQKSLWNKRLKKYNR